MSQVSAHPGHGGHDAHGHDHPAQLAHHFDSMGQQFSSGKLGMWLFLATEVLFFGGLFVFYSVWRSNHPEIFALGATRLDWKLGALNTIILITSSVTMAVGVTMAQQGRRTVLLTLLALTFVGGAGFMGIKYIEYSHKIHSGLVWGKAFDPSKEHHDWHDTGAAGHDEAGAVLDEAVHEGNATAHDAAQETADGSHDEAESHDGAVNGAASHDAGEATPPATEDHARWNPYSNARIEVTRSTVKPAASGPEGLAAAAVHPESVHAEGLPDLREDVATYFSIYFCLTGLHGIHVLVGMGIMVWLFLKAWGGQFGPNYFTPVDLGGLYWHLVDLIWIFLFPLLYLI